MIIKASSYLAPFLLAAAPLGAQWLHYPTPGIPRTPDGKANLTAPAPRTPDGKPDLSGIWQADGAEDNPAVRDLEDVSPTSEGKAMLQPRAPGAPCLPPAIASVPLSPFKIYHLSKTLVMLSEYNLFRQIFMDGRPLPRDPNPTWLGYSVGRWDGDTLVVDTNGFNSERGIIGGRSGSGRLGPRPHSGAMHVVERFRRRDFGHMEVQFTIDDPKVYERPWSFREDVRLVPDTELLEYICEENEKDFQHRVGRQ
jgi:hypothetical protein